MKERMKKLVNLVKVNKGLIISVIGILAGQYIIAKTSYVIGEIDGKDTEKNNMKMAWSLGYLTCYDKADPMRVVEGVPFDDMYNAYVNGQNIK